jgi:hypothetical protein
MQLGMVAHTCNLSTGEDLEFQDSLDSLETLSQGGRGGCTKVIQKLEKDTHITYKRVIQIYVCIYA